VFRALSPAPRLCGRSEEFVDAGCVDAVVHRGFLRCGVSLRQGLPEVEVNPMHFVSAIALILSILLLVYLTLALLFPEKF
jgi:K+-transporting ATPase KdpF subunit